MELEKIDEEISSIPHNPEKSNLTEVGYRLAWARTYLKKYGFLENSNRGVWALTSLAKEQKRVDPQTVVKIVMLVGGRKSSQNRDIKRAQAMVDRLELD